MASPSLSKTFYFASIPLIIVVSVFPLTATSYQFQVGGEKGWIKPSRNETETYNIWATKQRFHVGDSLYFKYQNDSVFEVTLTNYKNCIISNPISKFKDGNTTFQFGRSGNFYFISGEPSHCNAGQKMTVTVMAEGETRSDSPSSAPSPGENGSKGNGSDGGDDDDGWDSINWGPPSLNSTIKMSIASCFMTVFAVVLAILYLLV